MSRHKDRFVAITSKGAQDRRPAPRLAFDIAATSKQWGAALDRMDKSRRLTLKETNRLLDTIVVSQDAEREAAGRALRARLARQVREKGGR
jgi:hypothetical protein